MEDSQTASSEAANITIRCALEEKIRMKEQQLAALFQRERDITAQTESSRLKYQRLMERSILLQKRRLQLRAVLARQKLFYREIQDSLVKSRERLVSLSMLESATRETSVPLPPQEDCKTSANRKDPNCDSEVGLNESLPLAGDLSPAMSSLDIHGEILFNEFCKELHSKNGDPGACKFLLPAIKPPLMEKIITLVMREANAMAIDNSVVSRRRRFIRNTCLDFVQLLAAEPQRATTNKNVGSKGRTKDDEGSSEVYWDPHGTLCPYEVSGVCADDYCPYQHFSKATKPKELIPLPPIRMSLLQSTRTGPGNTSHHPAPSDPVQRKDESTNEDLDTQDTNNDDEMEEEFISLPVAEETLESISKVDSTCDSASGHDTDSPRQKMELEWGGILDLNALTMDKTIASWIEQCADGFSKHNQPLRSMTGFIDSIRLSIHAGRFDLALKASSSCVACSCSSPAWVVSMTRSLETITKDAFISRGGGSFSTVRSMFTNQACLALISIHLSLARATIDNVEPTQPRTPVFHDAILTCIDSLRECDVSMDFSTTNPDDDLKVVLSSVVAVTPNELSEDAGMTLRDRFILLKVAMEWVQKNINPSRIRESAVHERKLHDLFDTLRPYLSHRDGYDQISSLSVVVLFGLATLGILEYLSAEVGESDPPALSLATDLAVWIGAISGALNDLSKGPSWLNMPLLDTLLAPLHAAIISANIILCQYDKAFNQLQDRLCQEITPTRPAALLKFSEMMWSQFLQMRMALPPGNVNTIPAKGEKGKVKSKEFEWALSKAVIADNWRLVAKLEHLGVYLHHITLLGDSILLHNWNGKSSEEKIPLLQILGLIFQSGQPSSSLQLSLDLASEEEERPASDPTVTHKVSRLPLSLLLAGETLLDLNLSGCSLGALPPSFGLYFPKLITLDISRNQLISIPLSFHRMICLSTLNVSYNRLSNLSGEELMASLTVFDLSHNNLTTAVTTASTATTAAAKEEGTTVEMETTMTESNHSNSNNSGSSASTTTTTSLFVVTLIRRCFQLQVLNLSWNELSEEELEQSMVPLLVLHLKQLHMLTTHPQRPTTIE